MSIKSWSPTLLVLLLVGIPAFGVTYYVDPGSGSDANNGLAMTTAWASLPSNDGGPVGVGWPVKIKAGDTIWVKGGTTLLRTTQIDSTWYNDGAAGSLITIKSGDLDGWGTGRAIVDGQANPANGIGVIGKGFFIFGVSYVHIEGFEIRNMANLPQSAGIYVSGQVSNHCELVGNLIHEIFGQPGDQGYGIEITGTSDPAFHLVERNVIYHVEQKAIELFRQGSCIVRYNYCYETNDHCMVVSSPNNVIYGNIFRRSGYPWMQYELPFRPAFGFKFQSGLGGPFADNNQFYNNIVIDCSSGVGFLGCVGNLVAFNTVVFTGFQPPPVSGGPEGAALAFLAQNVAPSNNIAENNIFYYGNVGPVQTSGSAVFYSTTTGSGNTVTKNCFFMNESYMNILFSHDNPTTQFDLATFEGSTGFASISTGNNATANVVADPLMAGGSGLTLYTASPTGFDSSWHPNTSALSLTTSTPLSVRQGGVPLPAPLNADIVGTPRVGWSMGAYEYNPASPPPPPPPPGGGPPPTGPLPPSHLRIKT